MSFPNTRLSVVARTRSGDEETRRVAYATIIEAYWKPAYKHLRMKWSLDPDTAADLTQEFFTSTLEKDIVERYDPERSRFRTFTTGIDVSGPGGMTVTSRHGTAVIPENMPRRESLDQRMHVCMQPSSFGRMRVMR